MGDRTSLRLNDVRERRLERLKETFGENTNAKALDKASMHTLRDEERLRKLADELEDEFQNRADRYVGGLFSLNVEVSVRRSLALPGSRTSGFFKTPAPPAPRLRAACAEASEA